MSDFVHLHVHSHYSLLNGLTKIKALVKATKKKGFSAIALTDYGSMYGAIEFYQKCIEEEIKPIIGFEAFVAPRSRHDRDPEKDKDLYSIVLLAENFTGYRNLMHLSSKGHLEGFFNNKPRVDKELLKEFRMGIITLSGSIDGEVSHLLKVGKIDEAQKVARQYEELFGVGNFYLELQDHPAIEGQLDVNTKLIQLSKDTGIPMVVTRDVHYLEPDEAQAQDILRCISEGWKVDQSNREDMRHVDRSLNTADDISSRFRHVPEAIENTVKIANRIDIKIPLNEWHFAPVDLPPGKNADEYLWDESFRCAPQFYPEMGQEITDRLNYELDIIKTKGYSPYFICVADYVKYAKDNGIVESTRGSAAGSLVSFVLGITTVDPMRFKLPFERFLNPFRPSPPDVDTDFADDRRDEMIAYVTKKYGEDKVAQIITFGTMAARASVRDVGRALGLSYGFCDQVAKLIPQGAQGFPMTIARALKEEPDLKKIYDANGDVKRLLDLAQQVEGCARHTSIHAAGVVISPTPLTDFTPVQRETGEEKLITQYEMKSVETAGVLKNDFLGIRNLAILGNAVVIVEKTTGDKIDIYNLPLDDTKTFEMLARGETMGVFQLGGSGMTRWLKELRPNRIEDIMAMVALYRPGPMESIPEYIRRKYNPEAVSFLDPRLEKILDASYGLLVYQDDVMLTAIELAGYDWMEADKFRKAMGKKIPEEMAKQKEKFYDGCKNYGKLKKETVDELWRQIEPFAAYGFNKCVVGSTEIINPKTGVVDTIEDLYKKQKRVSVLSLDKGQHIVPKNVPAIYANGKKKVWKLKTRSGREIVTTSNHLFLTFDDWRKLEDLEIGQYIAVPRFIPYTQSHTLSKEKLRLLGYLLSEGNVCHPNGVYLYSSVSAEVQDMVRCTQAWDNAQVTIDTKKKTVAIYIGKQDLKKSHELLEWIKTAGLWYKKAIEKFVPQELYKVSQQELSIFLGALWQGDGCIHSAKGGQIYYATSSKRLAFQVQHLLLRLNILSTIHSKSFRYRGTRRQGFTVNISRYTNIRRFRDWIGPHLLQNKRKILAQLIQKNKILNGTISNRSPRGSADIVPAQILSAILKEMKYKKVSVSKIVQETGLSERLFYVDVRRKGYLRETLVDIATYLQSDTLKSIANSDIYWDAIVSIEPQGIQETYDLTVPDTHNFVANDFIVHNSHAASYGIVAYQTAYMKAHYPVQYMTSVLQAESSDADKISAIVAECRRINIEVLPPDVNESFKSFAMVSKPGERGRIRFGLTAIKNVGEHICEVIYRERKEHGQFTSLENFLERIEDKDLNKKSVESLAMAGALDSFGIDRGVLMANSEHILGYIKQLKEKRQTSQNSLFAGTDIALDSKVRIQDAPLATLDEKLKWEKTLLGIYVSSHPFSQYQKFFKGKTISISDFESYPRDNWVVVGGVIDVATKKITKKGSVMMFVTLQDETGSVEMLVFPKMYEVSKDIWVVGNVICVIGKTPKEEGDNKIFVEKAYILTKENAEEVARYLSLGNSVPLVAQEKSLGYITITLTQEELKNNAGNLKKIFEEYPGSYDVYVKVGMNTIRTQAKVEWGSGLETALTQLFDISQISVSN